MEREDFFPKLSPQEEKHRSKIQSKISYCYNCQPCDGGIFWILGNQTCLEDLMDDCRIPLRYRENILPWLSCSNCGTADFTLYTDVGTPTESEKRLTAWHSKANVMHKKHVQSFEEHLLNSPTLALGHSFGRRILKEIREHKLPTTCVQGKFFRARKINSDQIFKVKDMLQAPLGKPSDGRFNHAGQSHLYLSTERNAALREVLDQDCIAWVTSLTLTEPIDKILDLDLQWSDDISDTESLLLHALTIKRTLIRSDRNLEKWTPDYYLTKFIMDCAKSCGYKGIRYTSAKESSSSNIVLFYPDHIKNKKDGKPKLVIYYKKRRETQFYHKPDL